MQKDVDALLKVVERSHEWTSGSKRKLWGAGDDKEVRLTNCPRPMMWRFTLPPSSR